MFSIYTADFELQILPVAVIDGSTLTTTTPGGHRLALPEEGQTHDSGDLAFIHNLIEGLDGPGKFATYPESDECSPAKELLVAIQSGKPPLRNWRDWIPDLTLPDWQTFASGLSVQGAGGTAADDGP